jgi:hypothetical protein
MSCPTLRIFSSNGWSSRRMSVFSEKEYQRSCPRFFHWETQPTAIPTSDYLCAFARDVRECPFRPGAKFRRSFLRLSFSSCSGINQLPEKIKSVPSLVASCFVWREWLGRVSRTAFEGATTKCSVDPK